MPQGYQVINPENGIFESQGVEKNACFMLSCDNILFYMGAGGRAQGFHFNACGAFLFTFFFHFCHFPPSHKNFCYILLPCLFSFLSWTSQQHPRIFVSYFCFYVFFSLGRHFIMFNKEDFALILMRVLFNNLR